MYVYYYCYSKKQFQSCDKSKTVVEQLFFLKKNLILIRNELDRNIDSTDSQNKPTETD